MKRKGSAIWNGTLKGGSGTVSSESGAVSDVPYSFSKRFGDTPGTNPEELIGAAHAGCFSMALSAELENAGMNPETVNTVASVSLENTGDGFAITSIHLDVTAKVPGANNESFQKVANQAKVGCPVSRVLRAEITMTATLEA
jgi:osmotically inducible protein OsmC